MKPVGKIPIANRGEIALRVLRACRQMGIRAVTVYSDADRDALHARLSDEAVHIGPAAARDSYLRIDRILEAARRAGADAIHPGYGFLAENAGFAEACESAGITFIGPPARVIGQMGRKTSAREAAMAAGVPVLPAIAGGQRKQISFPVVIKAASGGGGRGMRLARSAAEMETAIQSARREAESAFGDGELLVEKYLEEARHIEFQILGDLHGRIVHLFERDCSIQRRYQKIIEEAPSPVLTAPLRERMAQAALAVCRAIGYSSAGTVEFLLAPTGEFYFLEVNTRIQVEHPVTEMITGLDLVQWQIAIAEGRPLPAQAEIPEPRGHSIEARLYAEDPSREFIPSAGTLHLWRPPSAGPGLRIDSGVEEGMAVGIHYDSLLAKLISHGQDRQDAARRLAGALRDLAVLGVETNREYLLGVLESEGFRAAKAGAGLLARPSAEPDPAGDFLFAAALVLHLEASSLGERARRPGIPPNYRNNPYRDPSMKLKVGGEEIEVSWKRAGSGRCLVCSGGRKLDVEILSCGPGVLRAAMDGIQRSFEFRRCGDEFFVHSTAGSRVIRRLPRFPAPGASAGRSSASSPMPGQVLRILVEQGQAVRAGDPLVVLEAMKMEQTIETSIDGVVGAVLVRAGEVVQPGQALVQIRAQETSV